jgi:hypothetical protein
LGAAHERTRGTRGHVVTWAVLVAGATCRQLAGRAQRDDKTRGLVRVTQSDAGEGWDAWAQVATAHR